MLIWINIVYPNQHQELLCHSKFIYCNNKHCWDILLIHLENDLILDKWIQNAAKCWHLQADVRKRGVKIKVRDNTASDNHCFSQSAIKNPRMLNQAWLQIYTKWFIINTLQPLISYYSDKLHLTITEEMKVGFMTLEPIAKDGECLKSEVGEKIKSLHLYTWW